MTNVQITVLMSVYNSEFYLHKAIDSILTQSFRNFEFLIINDASTDRSTSIIESYADSRIKLIHNENNLGLAKSLNKGLMLAQGKYIARMDADDISLSKRLEKQVTFMEHHPEVGVCGTWFELMGQERVIRHPAIHQNIVTFMFKNNGIGHPTAIIRKDLFIEQHLYYDESYAASQDYDLWVRASQKTKLANIPEVLVQYRIHSGQVSTTKLQQQKEFAFQAKKPLISSLTKQPFDDNIDLYKSLFVDANKFKAKELNKIVQLMNEMIYANAMKKLYNQHMLGDILFEQYVMLLSRIKTYSFTSIYALKQFILFKQLKFGDKVKLFLNIIG